MSDVKPKKSGVLHSRSRQNCIFLKSPKQKGTPKSKSDRKKNSPDIFKSIEITKDSKYVSVKKFGIGQTNPNQNLDDLKRKL